MSLLLELLTIAPTIDESVPSAEPPGTASAAIASYGCVHVTTITHRRVMTATVYDCVRFVVVRDGSVILTGEGTPCPVTVGDVVLIAPNARFEYEPEGIVTVTTIAVDTDYLIEQFFWQHLTLIPDRDAARDLVAQLYPDPVQILRLGEREVERLGPILGELVTRTEAAQDAAGYFRTQALLLTVLEATALHVRHAPVEVPPLTSHQRVKRIAPPRWREYRPVRREAALAAALMHSDIAKPWRLPDSRRTSVSRRIGSWMFSRMRLVSPRAPICRSCARSMRRNSFAKPIGPSPGSTGRSVGTVAAMLRSSSAAISA